MVFIDPDGMFEYSDGYSTAESRNSTGAMSHSGTFTNEAQAAGTIQIQVLGTHTKSEKQEFTKAVKIFSDKLKSLKINAKVELSFSDKIKSKKEFFSQNDGKTAYILLGSASRLSKASKEAEEGGWERIYGEGDRDFSQVGGEAAANDPLAFVNTDKTSNSQIVEWRSSGPVSDGYGNNSNERTADYIRHEHAHLVYSRYHTQGTILQRGPTYKGADYSPAMVKKLKSFYGTTTD